MYGTIGTQDRLALNIFYFFYIEIHKYPSAQAELEKLWRDTIKDKMSIVCVEDTDKPTDIIGVNILTVVSKHDKEEEFKVSLIIYYSFRIPYQKVSKWNRFFNPGLRSYGNQIFLTDLKREAVLNVFANM